MVVGLAVNSVALFLPNRFERLDDAYLLGGARIRATY